MAKAIVRVNAFLSEKQMKDVYNLIYDQVKAGLEIITVPAYCDVYVLNGADIEVQKKDTVKKESENKGCSTCKYETNPIPAEPCFSCIHGLCDENPNRTEKWEAKDND